jgi:hypothetical protein
MFKKLLLKYANKNAREEIHALKAEIEAYKYMLKTAGDSINCLIRDRNDFEEENYILRKFLRV